MLSATALPERAGLLRLALTLSHALATRPSGRRVCDAAGHIPGRSGMSRDSLHSGIPIEFNAAAAAARATLTAYGRSVTSRAVAPRKRTFWHSTRNDSIDNAQALTRQIGNLVVSVVRFCRTDLIDTAMERLRRRARAVIWLNPLRHLEGYEPLAAGMAAALKHVDVFAPVHDLPSMWDLVSTIRTLATRPRGGFQPRGLERRNGMAPEPQMSVTSSGGDVAAWRDLPPERREGT
jgi:hypothetical protein